MSDSPDRALLTHSDATAIANAAFVECEDVRNFLARHVRPLIERPERSEEGASADATVHGALLRVLAWMFTLGKLDDPMHFQADLAAVRAIFEIAVDLSLLQHDPAHHQSAQIVIWERSAKLALAEKTREYYERTGADIDPSHTERLRFARVNGPEIRRQRRETWPNRRKPEQHPSRWTGRTLRDDAHRAEALGGYGFAAFYDLRYAEWCWGTHGSGLASVRAISPETFPAIAAFSLREAAQLGLVAGRLVLEYSGLWDAVMAVRFEHLEKDIEENRIRAFATQKGYLPRPTGPGRRGGAR